MRLADLLSRAEKLKTELQEIEVAIRVLRRYEQPELQEMPEIAVLPGEDEELAPGAQVATSAGQAENDGTTPPFRAKAAIVELLHERRTIHRAQIIPSIKAKWGVELTHNTVASTLSKNPDVFKSKGAGVWTLVTPSTP